MITGVEIGIVLLCGVLYTAWEMAKGPPKDVQSSKRMSQKEIQIRQGGSLSDGKVLSAKELELLVRGAEIPQKDDLSNPAAYQAKVDEALEKTSYLASAYQPMQPSRLQAYELTNARTASKVMMDMMMFNERREPLLPPNDYFDD
jgi:hypothetical protein